MDAARNYVARPFIVHFSTDGIHNPDSLHYTGGSLDGHFVGLSAVDQYLLMEQFNPPGLGFYSYWNSQGVYIDIRILKSAEKVARWWRYCRRYCWMKGTQSIQRLNDPIATARSQAQGFHLGHLLAAPGPYLLWCPVDALRCH